MAKDTRTFSLRIECGAGTAKLNAQTGKQIAAFIAQALQSHHPINAIHILSPNGVYAVIAPEPKDPPHGS